MDETDTLQKDSSEIYLRKEKDKIQQVGPIGLFRFADGLDVVLIIFGTVMSMVHGLMFPLMCIMFGNVADTFIQYSKMSKINTSHANSTTIIEENTLQENVAGFAIYFIITSAILNVAAYMQGAFFALTAGRQIKRIRKHFFHSIMRQDIGWFDVNETTTLNTRLIDDIWKIQEFIGDKMGMLIHSVSTFILSVIISLVIGWKLALVTLAACPFLGLSATLFNKVLMSYSSKEQAAYAKADAVAQEVLSAIRTVLAFNGQQRELERYHKCLEAVKKIGVERSINSNLIRGFSLMVMYLSYALAFWYGSTLILSGDKAYTIGTVLKVLFTLFAGTFAFGKMSPNLKAFVIAQGAAHQVYTIIDRKSPIDSYSKSGFKPDSVNGNIEFRNVHFNYPSRPGVKVLNNMSLSVKSGQTIALVGSSGCGKSTIIQLLQRFYDPHKGTIAIDDYDIRSLNICYLRGMIGVVNQEPVLFATSIAENIRYGRTNVTQHELEQAAKEANAYDFIMNLPEKFETVVGDRGTQMSGGQKQRIAIARVLVRQPKILLLDEATSALDSESKTIVQAALDKVRLGRTTIIVAHSLSTIRNADMIAVFQHGEVVELGTHSQLMRKKGVYHTLSTIQMFQKAKDKDQQNCEHNENCSPVKTSETSTYRWKSTKCSSSADVEENKESENLVDDNGKTEEVKSDPPSLFLKVMHFNLAEWPYILLGIITAAITGIAKPVYGVLISKFISLFGEVDQEMIKHKAEFLCLMFAVAGFVVFFRVFLQGFCFGKAGAILTMKLRLAAFEAMMRQEISWFDDPKNSVGALTARLASDSAQVIGVTELRLATLVKIISNMGSSIIISFVHGWELTLFILVLTAISAGAGALKIQMKTDKTAKIKKELEKAGEKVTEVIKNIRTVASLTSEPKFESLYENSLEVLCTNSQEKDLVHGFVVSFSQALLGVGYAGCFLFGAWLIEHSHMDVQAFFLVILTSIYGSASVGEAYSLASNYANAKTSAAHIVTLLNSQPAIDNLSHDGQSLDHFYGNVHLEGVTFNYPTRSGVPVLRALNLKVSQGETLALVGSSGCGKSTTLQLLERFYDAKQGNVMFDSVNVKELNIHWLRSQIGIVSQEPVLFDCSLAENIGYGDNSRAVTIEEIKAAAEKANIHRFIEKLPKKYDTQAGDKGTQLSGGQKQQIAIARAILRNPKLLLLDEATSALDTDSEKMVQDALDKARQGRTCIIAAHRLSTIQNADRIAVFQGGVVVEQGTHQQLLAKKGVYHTLVTTQLGYVRE